MRVTRVKTGTPRFSDDGRKRIGGEAMTTVTLSYTPWNPEEPSAAPRKQPVERQVGVLATSTPKPVKSALPAAPVKQPPFDYIPKQNEADLAMHWPNQAKLDMEAWMKSVFGREYISEKRLGHLRKASESSAIKCKINEKHNPRSTTNMIKDVLSAGPASVPDICKATGRSDTAVRDRLKANKGDFKIIAYRSPPHGGQRVPIWGLKE